MTKVLVIGFGNPGRLDDGLGPALAAAIEEMAIPGITVDSDYQLTVEDAATAAEHDVVIFADADVRGPEPFYLKRIDATDSYLGFSSHSVRPKALIGLTEELFGKKVDAFILGIRGYDFNEFGEKLSTQAKANLDAAIKFLADALQKRDFSEIRAEQVEEVKIDS